MYILAAVALAALVKHARQLFSVVEQEQTSNQTDSTKQSSEDALEYALSVIPVSETLVVMAEVVLPSHADIQGICFGGQILSWIDICGGIAAKKVSHSAVVTASVDTVHFLKPSRVGDVLILSAMVNRTFNTSMEVGVRVETENMKTGERSYCCSAYLTFVSINRNGNTLPTRQVEPIGSDQERRFRDAAERRKQRLERRSVKTAPLEWRKINNLNHLRNKSKLDLTTESNRRLASETIVNMTEFILPNQANTIGITFGGAIMEMIEKCAYVAGSRLCRNVNILSAGVDSLHFHRPTHVGDIVYFTAQVTASFKTSLEVMISVYAEKPGTDVKVHCNDAFMTLVAVDDTGKPITSAISELVPHTQEEIDRFNQASLRRQNRLQSRKRLRRGSNAGQDEGDIRQLTSHLSKE